VFDGDGSLVANAPHMPVHLGSMDRAVENHHPREQGRHRAGDVYAINAPYNGGTHLPDITVCTPVFDTAANRFCSGCLPARYSSRWATSSPVNAADIGMMSARGDPEQNRFAAGIEHRRAHRDVREMACRPL